MPHAARPRSRASILLLILSLVALPALAAEPAAQAPRHQGFFLALWQALTDLVPGLEQLGPGLDPLGGDHETDLGPELDPLG